ncbi:tetratricopeptide repeat protein [Candidatus Latescibacterota bacterium]
MRLHQTLALLTAAAWACSGSLLAETEELVEEGRPDSIRKYRFLANQSRTRKDDDAALTYYQRLLSFQPDYQRGHYYVGQFLYDKGQLKEAKAALLRSASLDSLHLNTSLALYQVYMDEDNADSAWVCLDRALRIKGETPAYGQYRRRLADLFRRQGRTQSAIEHYTALVVLKDGEAQPGDRDLVELVADLYRELGQVDEALAWQERLLAMHSGGKGEARPAQEVEQQKETLSSMVDLLVGKKDIPAALETLRRLAKVDKPGRYGHYHRMAQLADEAGDEPTRVEALRGMVSVNVRDLESLATLIEIYLDREDHTRATRWLERGLKDNPADPHLHLLQGDLLVELGHEESALASFEVAKVDPAWHDVAQQRIWQIRPPETEEEKLKREFFGGDDEDAAAAAEE